VIFLKPVISVGRPSLLLVPGIKKLATLLAVITNYVILKMALLPYIIGLLCNSGAINCTVHTCYVI
jgi:hypothetical protein